MQNEKKRILIVDDNPSIHEDFRKVFELDNSPTTHHGDLDSIEIQLFGTPKSKKSHSILNVDLVSAHQGEEALAIIKEAKEQNNPFQVAFIDMRMPPGWDGLKTIEEISKVDPELQFVVCTAYSDHGANDFLNLKDIQDRLLLIKKPFDHLEILLVSNALSKKWELTRLAKAKMEDLEDTVKQRTAMLENSNRLAALGEMAAGIAHEVNNPLTIINANCSILQTLLRTNKFDEERFHKSLRQIQDTVFRITKIIQGLRIFSRDGSNDSFENCEIEVILNDTFELCQKKLENSEITIYKQLPEAPLSIPVNRVQLSQVFLNLIINAKDAIEEFAGEKWIKIVVQEQEQNVVISFIDSGPGIPEEIQRKIMNPFFTTKPVGKGTGLGLSISHSIIAAHQGRFTLDAQSPNTKFDIILPKIRKN